VHSRDFETTSGGEWGDFIVPLHKKWFYSFATVQQA